MKRGHVVVRAAALAPARTAYAGHRGVPAVAPHRARLPNWLPESRQPVVVVDLRTPRDFRRGHLPGALSVPRAELDRRFAEIPTQPMVVLYCQWPLEEAASVYHFLEGRGDANHVVLQEGYDGWLNRRYPVVTSPA